MFNKTKRAKPYTIMRAARMVNPGLTDCLLIFFLGPEPSNVFISNVGAMAGSGRQWPAEGVRAKVKNEKNMKRNAFKSP